jgi:2-C-methyl-D-erythritol 4-phosphate cytidylyltransferase/2-C-methyl-D-erythritol 2,4-cyclodiphosphate synthase
VIAQPKLIRVAAIIVAAGRGTRAGGAGGPAKQYRDVAGRQVLTRTLEAFASHPGVDAVLTVIHADDRDLYDIASGGVGKLLEPAYGGATRQESVRRGLAALANHNPKIVLIHDAARPFIAADVIDRAIEAARLGAAVPVLPVTDTISVVKEDLRGETLDRACLRVIQTPQSFLFTAIRDAHEKACGEGRDDFTDDGAVAAHAGLTVTVFPGDPLNMKLTTPDDFSRAEERLLASLPDIRTGTGFDVHEFCDGDHVWLGGVRIPHDHGVLGHSDADVALHALTDAIFGAIGEGDIGTHFPPSDPQWKGASSSVFLAFAADKVKQRGGIIANVDIAVLSEAPKVGPHRAAIQKRIGEILGIAPDRVGIKATTMEGRGFIGRREGLCAIATATIRLPV